MQLFNLSVVSIQHKFLHICGRFVFFTYIYLTQLLPAKNRDGLSHAWLFKLFRVNVMNVHG